MGKSGRGKRDVVAKHLANQEQRKQDQAFDNSPVQEAHQILAELDGRKVSYRLSYYAVQPEDLAANLNVPVDGKLHAHHDVIIGKTLHLDESARRDTITAASRDFTGPFIAVIRRPEHVASPVAHATIMAAVDLSSEMLMGPLQIVQVTHRIERLHFAGLLGLSTTSGEWTADDRGEMKQLIADFQLRVEAEAVIVAGAHMAELEH